MSAKHKIERWEWIICASIPLYGAYDALFIYVYVEYLWAKQLSVMGLGLNSNNLAIAASFRCETRWINNTTMRPSRLQSAYSPAVRAEPDMTGKCAVCKAPVEITSNYTASRGLRCKNPMGLENAPYRAPALGFLRSTRARANTENKSYIYSGMEGSAEHEMLADVRCYRSVYWNLYVVMHLGHLRVNELSEQINFKCVKFLF